MDVIVILGWIIIFAYQNINVNIVVPTYLTSTY